MNLHGRPTGDPENDSGIAITLPMDSGADHNVFDSNPIPRIEEMMRNVRVLEPRMEIETFGPKPAQWVNSGILQLNARNKDGNWMPLPERH